MTERRFNEPEASAIFERTVASEDLQRRMPAIDGGLTASDLQKIGQEVVWRRAITDAVSALDAADRSVTAPCSACRCVEHVILSVSQAEPGTHER